MTSLWQYVANFLPVWDPFTNPTTNTYSLKALRTTWVSPFADIQEPGRPSLSKLRRPAGVLTDLPVHRQPHKLNILLTCIKVLKQTANVNLSTAKRHKHSYSRPVQGYLTLSIGDKLSCPERVQSRIQTRMQELPNNMQTESILPKPATLEITGSAETFFVLDQETFLNIFSICPVHPVITTSEKSMNAQLQSLKHNNVTYMESTTF